MRPTPSIALRWDSDTSATLRPMSEQAATASEIAHQLLEADLTASSLEVQLGEVGVGRAEVTMVVRPDMCNGLGMCHGGVIFTLADCAFEYSCNSHGRPTVAAAASVEFVRPAAVGEELTALSEEQHRGRRSGTYDVRVTNGRGEIVALFRGRSHELPGETP